MKIIAIGDIHGIDAWKEAVNQDFDVCVFVGDYFDSFDLSADIQIKNFKEIVEFKKTHDNVVMLMGNHDLHYLLEGEQYSGFNRLRKVDIREALEAALPELKKAYAIDDLLFSHAGVTKTWAEANEIDMANVADSINRLHLEAFGFNELRDKSYCGDHKSQGPMWVRPDSLEGDIIDGFTQIVGHTRCREPIAHEKFMQIDSLWNGHYVEITDGEIIVRKITHGDK